MTKEEQAKAASEYAAWFKGVTGRPILVGPNQMKYFRDNGVDCSNLRLYPEMLK